ncbi:unnamed protein product [Cylindrotheca closterium]|uniref:Uncharacterized protein n=1 Tax=Cylindrotheca closterium TaxID=2856 RepID=A0AAD2GE13_9STRA|nr:unnamed protein product [Cylindrotheca closterium]
MAEEAIQEGARVSKDSEWSTHSRLSNDEVGEARITASYRSSAQNTYDMSIRSTDTASSNIRNMTAQYHNNRNNDYSVRSRDSYDRSIRSNDTINSNIRNMTAQHLNRKTQSGRGSRTIKGERANSDSSSDKKDAAIDPPVPSQISTPHPEEDNESLDNPSSPESSVEKFNKDEKVNSDSSHENDATTVPSIPSQITTLQPEEVVHESSVDCTMTNIVGAIICGVFAIGWLVFLFWKDGGPDLITKQKSPSIYSWNPPTADQCSSISNGTLFYYDADSRQQERIQVKLEVQLQSELGNVNVANLESEWKKKLQEHVMPTLAGCEEDVQRRLYQEPNDNKSTLRQRRRLRTLSQLLPDHVISYAFVVDTTLSWDEILPEGNQGTFAQVQTTYTYPFMIDIDLWLKEDVNDALLNEKVSQVFNDFLNNGPLQTDLALDRSKLINVQQSLDMPTDDPTVFDGATVANPDPSTNAPVAMPTRRPTSVQTLAPSESPSIDPTGLPVTENPTLSPANQSPNDSPTSNSTL